MKGKWGSRKREQTQRWAAVEAASMEHKVGMVKKQNNSSLLPFSLQCPLQAEPNRKPTDKGVWGMWFADF